MCGRFTQPDRADIVTSIEETFGETLIIGDKASETPYASVSREPGDEIAVVVRSNNDLILTAMHWGYPDPDDNDLLFNTRIETADEKRTWRNDFKFRRCIIPVDSFFENRIEFAANDASPLLIGGIFTKASHRISKELPNLRRTSMLTTQAQSLVKTYKDRQPAIIPPTSAHGWLDREAYENQVVTVMAHRQRLIVVG